MARQGLQGIANAAGAVGSAMNTLRPGSSQGAQASPQGGPAARSVQELLARIGNVASAAASIHPIIGRDAQPEDVTKWIRFRESSNNYQAKNSRSTASGAYQYIDGTWDNYGGYPTAAMAPPEVQDRRFQEDLARRIDKYDGDVYKAIAEHYLPALANRPETWSERVQLGKNNVDPVAEYVRGVLKDTPLEESFDAYLQQFQ